MTLEEAVSQIKEPDSQAARQAREHWNRIAKPLNSLGVLERDIVRIAAIQGKENISIANKVIVAMCADNGIVEEGVTQTGRQVTASVAERMGENKSCVCLMASVAGARVLPVDVGVAEELKSSGIVNRKVMYGTRNFLKEPAMSRIEALRAVEAGIETACQIKKEGIQLAGSGEMGIGNTTTSSALLSVLLGQPPRQVTGRGAGLDSVSFKRKIQVIEEGIRLRRPNPEDGLDVLSKVGGLDLAALAGFYIGCAVNRIPVVLDGLICDAAALAAVKICPLVKGYLLASHVSAEPAGPLVLKALGLEAAIDAGLCLGEGTGAAAFFPMLDMAVKVYDSMCMFEEMQLEQYKCYDTFCDT